MRKTVDVIIKKTHWCCGLPPRNLSEMDLFKLRKGFGNIPEISGVRKGCYN